MGFEIKTLRRGWKKSVASPRAVALGIENLEDRLVLSSTGTSSQALQAIIQGLPAGGQVNPGTPVKLTASVAGATGSVQYAWILLKSNTPVQTTSGPSVAFTPNDNSTYQVSLTATVAGGATATDLETLLVGSGAAGFVPPTSLQQGGFESPAVGTGAYGAFAYDPAGSAWTFAGGAGVAGNASGFTSGNPNAPEGTQVAFLQQTGSVNQTVSLAAGTYDLTFAAAQRGNDGSVQTFQVLVDGTSVGTFTPAGTSYAAYTTGNFTVTAGLHTVVFQGLNPQGGDNTAFVDQVQINPGSSTPSLVPATGVQQGGFEAPNVGAGSFGAFAYDPAGSAWTFAGDAGVAGNGSGFTAGNPNAPEGTQVAFLQQTGSFSQAVSLAAGTYDLTFSAAQRGNWQASAQTFKVLVDGSVVGTFTPAGTSYAAYTTGNFTVTAGLHTVAFVGLNPRGGDNTAFVDNVQLQAAVVVLPLQVSITGLPASGHDNVGTPVSLSAQATGGAGQDSYRWVVSTGGQAVASGTAQALAFTPSAAGTYQIALTATDTVGHTATASGTLVADAMGIQQGGFEAPNVGTGSFGAFAYNPTGTAWTFAGDAGVAGNGSGFTSGNPNAPQGTQVAVLQTDSSFSQSVNFAAGSYDLTFSAAQRGNWQASAQTFQVLVDGSVVGTFTPAGTSYAAYTTGNFTVTAGLHTVTFQGLNPQGGDNTAFVDNVQLQSATTVVVPPLQVSITGLPASGSSSMGAAVSLSAQATGGTGQDSFSWKVSVGGQTVATGTNVALAFTPAAAGTFQIAVTVTDSSNKTATASASLVVANVLPTVTASVPSYGQPGQALSFSASATDSNPADVAAGFQFAWNFGDGGTGSGATVSHTYAAAGTYHVTVTATAKSGGAGSAVNTVTVAAGNSSVPNEPLLYQSDLQYIGAFRVPNYYNANGQFSYGGTALAYNPANNSLFLVGYAPYGGQPIAEISIPNSIVNSSNLDNLATSTVLQPLTDVLDAIPNPISGATDGTVIGGLMVNNGQLIGTAYAYYSGAYTQSASHFTLSSLNLTTASVQGLYQLGNVGARLAAGYMTLIPSEWQAVLGATALTGLSAAPIISTESSGPAAIGFNLNQLGSAVTPTATTYVDYPVDKPLGPYVGAVDPLQNGTTTVNGAVFVPGTSSVLFIGTTGTNYAGYGTQAEWGDPGGGKGSHSLNGEYALQVWAYNASDYVAVKQGTLQPWQVQPYDVWNLTLPISGGSVGGAAFDPSTGRLYVSVLNVDTEAPYSSLPLIEVFQLNLHPPATRGLVAPQIGTLAVTPVDTLYDPNFGNYPAPGPIPAGTSTYFTAGNVYAITPTATVTQVLFYLDTNKTGVFNASTDQLLGSGTPSTIPNASHNWQLTISTTGLAPGTYTVFAQAKDSDGLFSNPFATTLTIM